MQQQGAKQYAQGREPYKLQRQGAEYLNTAGVPRQQDMLNPHKSGRSRGRGQDNEAEMPARIARVEKPGLAKQRIHASMVCTCIMLVW